MDKNSQFIYKCTYLFFTIAAAFSLMINKAGAKGYFQQEVNYTIDVKLDDARHILNGFITIDYFNHSDDTLSVIWMHLWPNAYKDNNSALVKQQLEHGKTSLYFAPEEERGYIDSLDFMQDGKPAMLVMNEIDYGYLVLHTPLSPGQKTTISTPFRVKIPSSRFSRLGHDGQAYYISQWYPKPAVYDSDGWHAMPYLDQGEFYAEFGTFDVSITLPSNYVISSTGICQTETENEWLSEKVAATAKKTVYEAGNVQPPSSAQLKTLHYVQDNVHDFAWFADKRYNVLKGSVMLPSGRTVKTWAFFTDKDAALWIHSIQYINDAVYYYSLWAGEYIYSSCSVAQGTTGVSTGMEYPMVTLIGSSQFDTLLFETTIVHEVGHNWFCGMLASNERRYPWMDEGVNSFYEMQYIRYTYGDSAVNELLASGAFLSKLFSLHRLTYNDAWLFETSVTAAKGTNQNPSLPAEQYTEANYGIDVYRKTGTAMNYLHSYLGDSLFTACMHNYFRRWSLKHPSPAGMQASFSEVCNEKLTWFFDDLIGSVKQWDYAITGISRHDKVYVLTVENKGEIAGPFYIHGLKDNIAVSRKAVQGFRGSATFNIHCDDCTSFVIDYFRQAPDANRFNNNIKVNGLFKKSDPLRISMFPRVEVSNVRRLCIAPAAGWNNYNEFMAGAVIYNKFLPVKNFEYAITPLFGFGDGELAGMADISYSFYPADGLFQKIALGVNGKRFAFDDVKLRRSYNEFTGDALHYLKIQPSLSFDVRRKNPRSGISTGFGASYIYVRSEETMIETAGSDFNTTKVTGNESSAARIRAQMISSRVPDSWHCTITGEGNNSYSKFSATAEFRFLFKSRHKGVSARLFGGVMGSTNTSGAYPFFLSGWSGLQDRWFDEIYFGRSETTGNLSQQMTVHDGGFKIYIPYARSDEWLAACNIGIDLPGSLPLSLFADLGTFSGARDIVAIYDEENRFLFDGGITVNLFKVLKIHFPLFMSPDIRKFVKGEKGTARRSFGEQIRFEVNLDNINPFYIRNKFL